MSIAFHLTLVIWRYSFYKDILDFAVSHTVENRKVFFTNSLRPSKRAHKKTLNYKFSDRSVHTARKKIFKTFFARALKFPKIFRAQNLEKLTRPDNFGAPHGRPTTRDEILRRDPKF